MCGICGIWNYGNRQPVDPDSIGRMMHALEHRGPDDSGYYISGSLGLGFRRLSIIDLAGGHQPMSDAEETVWVVFNGEIYNFPELKSELESHGHVFRTRSDTEVIVHGYKQWGVDVLNRLNGMFDLAVWDEANRRLMLGRDRAGIKPLYYKVENGRLLFASEIRSILAAEDRKADLDPTALNLFLRYRYTPSPLTLFKGIQKLAPGTRLIVENGEARVERWWNVKPEPFDPMPSPDEAGEQLLELYRRAVKRQLISDVPLGLLLSGGLDSGLMLALMLEAGDNWQTFTVGFGESYRDDELSEAAETAKVLGAPNAAIQLDRKTFEEMLPKITTLVEEPVASPSVVPMYYVCQRAREDVKVALMGQGPDELFGGYKRHLGVRYGQYWRQLPGWLRSPLRAGLSALPRNESIKRGLYSLGEQERMKRYQQVFSIMPGAVIDGLFKDGQLDNGAGDRILDCWSDLAPLMENLDELGGFQYLEILSALPDELLVYADKLSMAHSLEVRVPYLDHEIVEYVWRLDSSYKVRNFTRKWLHRRLCERYLPNEIVSRKKKGFSVNVVDDWFRQANSEKIDTILKDDGSMMYEYLKPEAVRRLVNDHVSGRSDNHKILYSLIVFEEWLRALPTGCAV